MSLRISQVIPLRGPPVDDPHAPVTDQERMYHLLHYFAYVRAQWYMVREMVEGRGQRSSKGGGEGR